MLGTDYIMYLVLSSFGLVDLSSFTAFEFFFLIFTQASHIDFNFIPCEGFTEWIIDMTIKLSGKGKRTRAPCFPSITYYGQKSDSTKSLLDETNQNKNELTLWFIDQGLSIIKCFIKHI
jgi:hypothetical protein